MMVKYRCMRDICGFEQERARKSVQAEDSVVCGRRERESKCVEASAAALVWSSERERVSLLRQLQPSLAEVERE